MHNLQVILPCNVENLILYYSLNNILVTIILKKHILTKEQRLYQKAIVFFQH